MAYRYGAAFGDEYAVAPAFDDSVTDYAAGPAMSGLWRGGLAAKFATALAIDGVGDIKSPVPLAAPLLLTIDQQPGDTSTMSTIIVGGPSIVSSIDMVGDQDFFRIDLVAGHSYEIGVYLKLAGPSGVPLADSYLELYDSSGHLITTADGGGPNTPSGLDALLTFTAEHTGTYFINARGFDNVEQDGPNGDSVGDYEVFAREADGFSYKPYYKPDSPLYAIDWGSQIDGSSRNPDGAEGPRSTGNAFSGAPSNPYGIEGKNVITYYLAKTGDVFIDEDPTTPGSTETMVAKGWSDWEISALNLAFDAYESVSDIVYIHVDTRAEADFVFVTYNGTPGPGVSLLGRMSPPDEENEGQAEFNALDERWTEAGLAPGGFTFTTLIHEMGHGHGLAHPHDNGGRSGVMNGVTSDGVAFDYTNGDFDLNQSVYTMMSYEDGWQRSPYGSAETTDPYGWLGGLMAFDIAAIQDKYGVNETHATGDDIYVLKDENAAGTFYSCIWDAGGTDAIVYLGTKDANIDLRAATLKYEQGGGGWISYAYGIYGGYTIANGVTIENATGGEGDDVIRGNDGANTLRGGLGDDTVYGGAGNDRIEAIDGGTDVLFGEDGADTFIIGAAATITGGAGVDVIRPQANLSGQAVVVTDFATGALGDRVDLTDLLPVFANLGGANPFGTGYLRLTASAGDTLLQINADAQGADWTTLIVFQGTAVTAFTAANFSGFDPSGWTPAQVLTGTAGGDSLTGGSDADLINGLGGADLLKGEAGNDVINGDAGADRLFGGFGDDRLDGGADDDQLFGSDGRDTLIGGTGNDTLNGGADADVLFGDDGADQLLGSGGIDQLIGGAGGDILTGGAAADTFVFLAVSDSAVGASDRITDFNRLEDRIDLRTIDADSNTAGDQAFHFVSAFSRTAGEAVATYDALGGVTTLQLDVNGDGAADFALLINGDARPLSLSDPGAAWLL